MGESYDDRSAGGLQAPFRSCEQLHHTYRRPFRACRTHAHDFSTGGRGKRLSCPVLGCCTCTKAGSQARLESSVEHTSCELAVRSHGEAPGAARAMPQRAWAFCERPRPQSNEAGDMCACAAVLHSLRRKKKLKNPQQSNRRGLGCEKQRKDLSPGLCRALHRT